ncbi:MAG: histidine phosphatase family protein [Gammaproteobacteria bacterium]|nr:histidine phosphatase family protein [Gammaproteobacteria bacterium]
MRLVLIRHAAAAERPPAGRDHARPLTAEGRRRMRAAAKGLRILIPRITQIAASPTVRTQQSALIVADRYALPDIVSLPALAPGNAPRAMLGWLRQQPGDAVLAAVGHEPDLGVMASWLLAGCRESFLPFRKGGACLIEFAGTPAPGAGLIVWLLTPNALRRLGG